MSAKKNKSVYSFLNAASAMLLTISNGLFGIIVTRLILEYFGSDFNGLNSTANQVVHVLMIVEGGFTTASNVALFKPVVNKDLDLINGVVAATRKKFRVLGLAFFVVGTVVAGLYALLANSGLQKEFIFTVIMMTMIPPAFNLFYATTYRVLLQAQQKEYVISLFTALTISLGHIANIIMITSGGSMWLVRVNTMTFALLNCLLIAGYVKRKNKFLNLTVQPREDMIKGTNDVMAQRITSVIYDSSPMVFLSVSPAGGTVLASVYAVYNNVFIIVKSLIRGAIDAPRLSIGQLLAKHKREDVWPVYAQYQYAAFFVTFVLLTTTCTLILPFVKLYTEGITDANYVDIRIPVLMIIVSSAELIHMPSSHLLNMAGEFKICKRIQVITCIVLLLAMAIGGTIWSVYGMLFALLISAMLLVILEMGYVHTRFFKNKLFELFKLISPLAVAGVLTCYFEIKLNIAVDGYLKFFICGALFAMMNAVIAVIVGVIFNHKTFMALFNRAKRIIIRK